MIRASIIAAAALALAACGGGGGGGAQAPAAAAMQSAAGTLPSTPASVTANPVPVPVQGLSASAPDVANTSLAGNQYVRNAGALAAGGHAVAWLSQDASGNASLFVQRYDANGAKSGGETRIAYDVAAQESPAIAVLRDGSVVVASIRGGSTFFMRRFDSSGAASGGEVVVASGGQLAQPVLLALADGGVAAGWASVIADSTGTMNALHAQRFDARLNTAGAQVDFAASGVDRNIALKLVALPTGGFVAGTTHRFEGIPYVGSPGTELEFAL